MNNNQRVSFPDLTCSYRCVLFVVQYRKKEGINKVVPYNQTVEIVIRESLLDSVLKSYGPLIIALVGIIIGYFQFKKQINRTMYEKRLSEVYAPLIGVIVKQEFFRTWEGVNISFKDAQIIELVNEKKIVKIENGNKKEVLQEYKFIDRNHFIKTVSDINLGVATPKLIKAIKEFELIVDIQEKTTEGSELFKIASNNQGKVELELLKEIINGYKDTVNKLGLDKKGATECLSFPYIMDTEKENY